jgi:uncharacterized protein (TIGR03435 family)
LAQAVLLRAAYLRIPRKPRRTRSDQRRVGYAELRKVKFNMQNRLGLAFVAGLLLTAGAFFGQTSTQPPPPKLAFDVASVRPAPPLDMAKMAAEMRAGTMPRIGPHVDASRAEYDSMSLKDLIALAYSVKGYQITGPDWLGGQRFDIVARLPDGASKDDAPAMLQALLQDRFKLAVHRETQERSVLALVVAKGGPKLKESPPASPIDENAPLKSGEMQMNSLNGPARVTRSPDGTSTINMGARGTMKMSVQDQTIHMESSNATMQGFADMLTNVLQMGGGGSRQVVDMTGLKGSYQVAVEIPLANLRAMARAQGMNVPGGPAAGGAADNSPLPSSDPDGGSTVFESVQALGLKLEQRKASVEQLIVDHVEKTPTEN